MSPHSECTSSALCSIRTSKRRPTERPGTNRMNKKGILKRRRLVQTCQEGLGLLMVRRNHFIIGFLVLVQQKQVAGPLTGKWDVRVKAAEATKRQAEQREMDWKLKKEAMKLERARKRKERLKLLREKDLEKKKENERKRNRAVEARKQQEYQKEKLCSKKEEKVAKIQAMEKKGVTSDSMPKNKCANNWSSSEAVESASVVPETCA